MTPTPPMSHLRGSVLVLATGVVFSFGALAFRYASDQGTADAWEYLFFRGLGAVFATCFVLVYRHRRYVFKRFAQTRLSHLGIGVVLGFISCAFIIALQVTTVAFVLLLQAMAPVAAAYFSWVIMAEKISRQAIIATVGTVIGVVVMFSGTITDSISPWSLFAVSLPIGFGLYATLVRSTENLNLAVPVLTAGMTLMVVGGAVVASNSGFSIALRDGLIGVFAGSFLFGFPLAVFNVAQRVVPSPETALLLMSEVVLGPIWAWLFVSEIPEVTTLLGGGIILSSVIWLTLSPRLIAR
jgi:drug/metabolite transporter (DMT)-like permease